MVILNVILFVMCGIAFLIGNVALGSMCRECLMVLRPGHILTPREKTVSGCVLFSLKQNKTRLRTFFFFPIFRQGSVTAAFSPKALGNPPWSGHDGIIHLPVHQQCPPVVRRWTLPISPGWSKNLVDRCSTDREHSVT